MGTLKQAVIRNIDSDLVDQVNQWIKEENRGVRGWDNRLSLGKVINELLEAFIERGMTVKRIPPAAILREMLGEVCRRAEDNRQIIGSPTVTEEEIRPIVTGVLARHGLTHRDTRTNYRQALIHGYLDANRERIDGQIFVDFRVKPGLDPNIR